MKLENIYIGYIKAEFCVDYGENFEHTYHIHNNFYVNNNSNTSSRISYNDDPIKLAKAVIEGMKKQEGFSLSNIEYEFDEEKMAICI